MSIIVSGYRKKSIAEQTGNFSYLVDLSVNNTTGRTLFGFSGDNDLFHFRLESGRIYDNLGKFIYGYNNGETVSFKGYVSPQLHNYYINNIPISLNGYKPTGYATYFYVQSLNCETTIDTIISGSRPEYQFGPVYFTGSNVTGTGIIFNTGGSRFRIYSGEEILSGDYYTLTVPTGDILPGNSGIYTLYRNFSLFSEEELSDNNSIYPFNFNTNFGEVTGNIEIITRFPITQTLTDSVFDQISGLVTGQGFLYWDNRKGQVEYSGALSGQLTVAWQSGIFTGSFNNLFTFQTGNLGLTNFNALVFNSGITGFSCAFDTFGSSGLCFRLIRNYYNSTGYGLNFNFTGYNTGVSYTINSY